MYLEADPCKLYFFIVCFCIILVVFLLVECEVLILFSLDTVHVTLAFKSFVMDLNSSWKVSVK